MDERDGGMGVGEDPLRDGVRIERVTRPDGRYLLYFSWPDAPSDASDDRSSTTPPGDDDV